MAYTWTTVGNNYRTTLPFTAADGATPLQVDVFVKKPLPTTNSRLVVCIPGGGFQPGDRTSLPGAARHYVNALGYVAIAPDYRGGSANPYDAAVLDVEDAISAVLAAHAADPLFIDTSLLPVLFGSSAGGTVAMELALRAPYACVVSWSGLTNFTTVESQPSQYPGEIAAAVARYTPTPELKNAASPVIQATNVLPPHRLVNSTDELMPDEQATEMEAALIARGVPVKKVILPGTKHAGQYGNDIDPETGVTQHNATTNWVAANLLGPTVPPAPPAWHRPIVDVPSEIDATGTTDVTDELTAFLASVPDGRLVNFPECGQYRCESSITLADRAGLDFMGNGSRMFRADTLKTGAQLRLLHCAEMVFHDLAVQGCNPEARYVAEHEFDHGLAVLASDGVLLNRCAFLNNWGEFVWVGHGGQEDPSGLSTYVTVQRCYGRIAGRQGISVGNAADVQILANDLADIGRTAIDCEPPSSITRTDRVVIAGNTVGLSLNNFVNFKTGTDLVISGNTVVGDNIIIHIGRGLGEATPSVERIRIVDNTADGVADSPRAVMLVNVRDAVVAGNHQSFTGTSAFVQAQDSEHLRVYDNTAPGGTYSLRLDPAWPSSNCFSADNTPELVFEG